jgi:hypothetical protein
MAPLGSFRTASGRSITAGGTEFTAKAEKSFGKQLYREGQGILASSQGLVPVDTGALKSSGYVTPPQREEGMLNVYIGYGGVAGGTEGAPSLGITAAAMVGNYDFTKKPGHHLARNPAGYAIYVHENLEAHHPVGMAKFLELPFNQATRGMDDRIANGMRADMKSNAGIGDYVVGDAEADYVF